MKKYVIDKEDLKGFIGKIEIASSYGMNVSKSLIAQITFNESNKVDFSVINHCEVVAVEQNLDKAIDIFNEI